MQTPKTLTVESNGKRLYLRVSERAERIQKRTRKAPYILCDRGHLERRITECMTCVMLGYVQPYKLEST